MKAIYCQRCLHFHTSMSPESSQMRTMLLPPVSPQYLKRRLSAAHNRWNRSRHRANLFQIWTWVSSCRLLNRNSNWLQKMQLPQSQARLKLNKALFSLNKMHTAAVQAYSLHLLRQKRKNCAKILKQKQKLHLWSKVIVRQRKTSATRLKW